MSESEFRPGRAVIPIEIHGVKYPACLDMRALLLWKKQTGKPVIKTLTGLMVDPSLTSCWKELIEAGESENERGAEKAFVSLLMTALPMIGEKFDVDDLVALLYGAIKSQAIHVQKVEKIETEFLSLTQDDVEGMVDIFNAVDIAIQIKDAVVNHWTDPDGVKGPEVPSDVDPPRALSTSTSSGPLENMTSIEPVSNAPPSH